MKSRPKYALSPIWRAFPLALALFAAVGGLAASAAPADQTGQQGEAVFKAKCVACHTIGGGTLVGPDLKGVTSRQSHDWLVSWITGPDQLLSRGDPIATELAKQYPMQMPNLQVNQADAEAILAYLEAQSDGAAQPGAAAQAAAGPLPVGDPAAGRDYFTGARHFENGGPPCMACHSVSGMGALGGGAVGPDLSGAYTRYGGEAGLTGVLENIAFPTMLPIFGQQALTPSERASIVAFLKDSTVPTRSTDSLLLLAGLGAAGALWAAAVFRIVWRNRLTGVRRSLVGGAR